jgi:hypothetical protein
MLVRSDLITSTLSTPVTSLRGAASAETDGPALATAEVPSTIVSNSTALEAHAASWTYMAPTRYVPASMQAWQSRSEDTVSKLMARNFSSTGNANRFNGLAGALLERFKTTPGDYRRCRGQNRAVQHRQQRIGQSVFKHTHPLWHRGEPDPDQPE